MARPKGSKNKKTIAQQQENDILAQIVAQEEVCETLSKEVEAMEAQIVEIKTLLKEKKAAHKNAFKALESLKLHQAEAEKEAAEAAARVELAEAIQKMLNEGMSAGDILNKLK